MSRLLRLQMVGLTLVNVCAGPTGSSNTGPRRSAGPSWKGSELRMRHMSDEPTTGEAFWQPFFDEWERTPVAAETDEYLFTVMADIARQVGIELLQANDAVSAMEYSTQGVVEGAKLSEDGARRRPVLENLARATGGGIGRCLPGSEEMEKILLQTDRERECSIPTACASWRRSRKTPG